MRSAGALARVPQHTAGADPKSPVFRPRSHLERAATGEKLYSKPTAKNATIN